MNYSQALARRIRELCKEREISVNRFATLSGIRQSTISNILHGVSKNPEIGTIQAIASAFGMTVSEFLDFPGLTETGSVLPE